MTKKISDRHRRRLEREARLAALASQQQELPPKPWIEDGAITPNGLLMIEHAALKRWTLGYIAILLGMTKKEFVRFQKEHRDVAFAYEKGHERAVSLNLERIDRSAEAGNREDAKYLARVDGFRESGDAPGIQINNAAPRITLVSAATPPREQVKIIEEAASLGDCVLPDAHPSMQAYMDAIGQKEIIDARTEKRALPPAPSMKDVTPEKPIELQATPAIAPVAAEPLPAPALDPEPQRGPPPPGFTWVPTADGHKLARIARADAGPR